MLPGPPRAGIVRRESSRLVKVPSRLEDDDPKAQLARIMDKCNIILRFIREKDVERGAFFSEPVDPVALGIPTYHQVISEPMDLRTLHRKMEAGEVTSPEEFARLARLVFENAMTFNVDPTHSVHQAARNLLILFNQKYRDIERMVSTLRRSQKDDGRNKKDKKRKRGDEVKSLRRRRLDEAQEMAANNATAMAAIVAAAPSTASSGGAVTRNEFNLMLQMMTQLQSQIVQTYTVLADTMSDDIESGPSASAHEITAAAAIATDAYMPPPEKKRAPKRKADLPKIIEKPAPAEDDSRPLTLQEQELLTETINDLPPEHLHGVIQIIREAAKLTGEEDEIDLEIDQLDTVTQRKLLKHVSKVRLVFHREWIKHDAILLTSFVSSVKSLSNNRRDKRLRPQESPERPPHQHLRPRKLHQRRPQRRQRRLPRKILAPSLPLEARRIATAIQMEKFLPRPVRQLLLRQRRLPSLQLLRLPQVIQRTLILGLAVAMAVMMKTTTMMKLELLPAGIFPSLPMNPKRAAATKMMDGALHSKLLKLRRHVKRTGRNEKRR